jgi:ABC-2 type transport system ATP-binding protein
MESVRLVVKDLVVGTRTFKVSNISFDIKNRDILGLVGRSGAGKSTLIKAIVGMKKPKSGTITAYLNSKEISLSEIKGYSPQGNALYPFLTLEENLMTFGKLHKMKKNEINERMDYLLKRLDLEESKKKRINEFSGGMQKRADLAATLIHSPRIIILDEPFTGLDIALQKFIWGLLKDLSKEGKIIIISSHALGDIQKNCNEFGLIERGYYYGTEQVMKTIKSLKGESLENYLERVFEMDLISKE